MQSVSILPIPQSEQGEFSFACPNPKGILSFADEIFHNGQIRPFFPAFLQNNSDAVSPLPPALKMLLVEKRNSFPSELKDGKMTPSTLELVEASKNNVRCKKRNSTGFSKQLRFWRKLDPRSNSSDSKEPPVRSDDEADNKKRKGGGKISKMVSSSSALEKHYLTNRMRNQKIKRRSFLPDKVGFFANIKGVFDRRFCKRCLGKWMCCF